MSELAIFILFISNALLSYNGYILRRRMIDLLERVEKLERYEI